MASTQREIRRATPQDFPELQKLWWRAQFDSEALEPRITDFQIIVENGRIIAALGLQTAARQGKVYAEAIDEPDRTDELRALLWARIQTWAKNLGLWRLWTPLTGPCWTNNGFQPHDPNAQIPAELNTDQTAFLVLQLGPEPSRAADAIGEMGMMEVAVRARRTNFLTQRKMLALYVPLGAVIVRLIFVTIFFHNPPPPRPLPKPPVLERKTGTNAPPKTPEPDAPNTIKA